MQIIRTIIICVSTLISINASAQTAKSNYKIANKFSIEGDYGWDYIVEFFKEHESGRDSLGCITPKPPKCHPDVRVDGRLLGDWPQTDFSKTKLEPQVRFDEA